MILFAALLLGALAQDNEYGIHMGEFTEPICKKDWCATTSVVTDMWCKELGGKNCEYTCQILFSLVSDDVETDCDDKPMMEKRKWSQNEFFYAPI